MYTENFAFYNSSNRQVVEDLVENFPNVAVTIFLGHFVVKSIGKSDISALMVASKQSDCVRVFDL